MRNIEIVKFEYEEQWCDTGQDALLVDLLIDGKPHQTLEWVDNRIVCTTCDAHLNVCDDIFDDDEQEFIHKEMQMYLDS